MTDLSRRVEDVHTRIELLSSGGERFTAPLERRLDEIQSEVRLLLDRQAEQHRETRMLLGQLSLPPGVDWVKTNGGIAEAPAKMAFPNSTLCRQDSFETGYFPYWMTQLRQLKIYHRKLWEHAFICQVLYERGLLTAGKRGLGFGVGSEPLTAYFASQGCEITGTDMAGDAAVEAGWTSTNEHAAGKEALRFPAICPDDLFDANVAFRVCDMNAIPDDLTGYDFCWSACAYEHLGSIEQGLAFVERSMDCLKPGGFAVHTTEYNVTSDTDTVSEGGTVLFRRRDMAELARRLREKGHLVGPLDLDPGAQPLDMYLDVPPYRFEPHVKLALQGFGATSFGLIAQKKPD
jgi:hypothetical protein